MKLIVNLIYKFYDKGKNSKKKNFLVKLHEFFFSNNKLIEFLFGFKIDGKLHKRTYPHKFDLTTILLKNSLDKLLKNKNKNLEILEVGTGYYALLSIYLKKKYNHHITAIDIEDDAITSSKLNCEKNNVNIDLKVSDLFENINEKKFDIIFWNLPYYRDVDIYLKPFLNKVGKFLNTNAKVLLGYNSTPLKPETIISFTKECDGIAYIKTESFFWNSHKISVLSKNLSQDEK